MASFLKVEKVLNISKNRTGKQHNEQNECIEQMARNGICILSIVDQHHCTQLCNMNVKGGLSTEWINELLVKRLNENAKILVEGTIGASGYNLSSEKDVVILEKSRSVVKTGLEIAIPKILILGFLQD